MKTQSNRKARQLGSTLLVTLIICTILCVSTMSYLLLLRQQNQLSARSQTWNLAIAYVEAGVEEGLEQLNNNYNNLATQGWTYDGVGYYIDRTMTGGSYRVSIYTTNGISNPVIIAKASVVTAQFAGKGSSTLFAAAGVTSDPTVVSRSVKVLCYRGGMFIKAMVSKRGITFNGNNITSDSFDSEVDGAWTEGVTPRRAKGDIASNENSAGAVAAGNANIYGHVAVGPSGTATWGPNVRIGDTSWGSGVQPGWITYDSNFTFPDVTLPYTSGITPTGGDVVMPVSSSVAIATTNSSIYPDPAPPSGVVTNTTMVTVTAIPGTIPSGFVTNSPTSFTATTLPVPPPSGTIVTNTINTTTASIPTSGTYLGSYTTNTSSTTSVSAPSPGTYVGSIRTNTTSTTSSSLPAAGTYVGTVQINLKNNGTVRDYQYNLITGYSYDLITGYTFRKISSYTYNVITYSYPVYFYAYSIVSTNTLYTTNHYDHILNSGDYYATDLTGTTLVRGTARLVLPNGLNQGSGDTFTVANGGAVEIYANSSCSVNGDAVIVQSGYAGDFTLYGTDNVTSFTMNGNGQFTGVLVAPNADIRMNGGGKDTVDFIGAMIVNSVALNGHLHFHYDERLGRKPATGRYLITRWDEIPNAH